MIRYAARLTTRIPSTRKPSTRKRHAIRAMRPATIAAALLLAVAGNAFGQSRAVMQPMADANPAFAATARLDAQSTLQQPLVQDVRAADMQATDLQAMDDLGMDGLGMDAASAEPVLAPGDYEWHPELSPAGEVTIVVSLPEQEVHVYRGGVRIGRSTISSGRSGHETPTGVFTILQKERDHHSNLYNNASMPYMERLTWDGIAMHAGHLPGHPASHGCIRLPLEFSKALYGVTERGGVVLVADDSGFAADLVSPGATEPASLWAAVEQQRAAERMEELEMTAATEAAASGTTEVVASSDVGAGM